MKEFFRCLHSDFIKIKRRPILLIHLLVPLAGIILFLIYFKFLNESSASKTVAFIGAVEGAFPIMIGLVCSMIADQENEAGNYQHLLTYPRRLLPFLSMTSMLLLLGLGSVILASFGFEVFYALILGQAPFGADFYFQSVILLLASNIFIYIFHIILSLRFGKGVSIGTGIVESLLSALLLTGMGDGIWKVIPCAWGMRFLKIFSFYKMGEVLPESYDLKPGIIFCIVETFLIFVFSLFWISRWEGKKSEE